MMSESLLKRPSLVAAANASMQSDIDRVGRSATWSNLSGWTDLLGWNDLFDDPDVWIQKVKAQWAAVGCSDDVIIAEAKRLYRASRE